MVHLLEDCNLCAIHAKRVTISALPVMYALRMLVAPSAKGSGRLRVDKLGAGKAMPDARALGAVPKDLQLARRIRGPIAGVSSY